MLTCYIYLYLYLYLLQFAPTISTIKSESLFCVPSLSLQCYHQECFLTAAGGHFHLAVWPDGCKQQYSGFLLHIQRPLPCAGTNKIDILFVLLDVDERTRYALK